MTKIKLIKNQVLKCIPTEGQLIDKDLIESIFAIRKLKALLESQEFGSIEASDKSDNIQAYSVKYQVWFSQHEYKILEDE